MNTKLVILIFTVVAASVHGRDPGGDKLQDRPPPSDRNASVAKPGPERFLKDLSFTQVVKSQIAAKKLETKMSVVQFVGEYLQDRAIGAEVQRAISDAGPTIKAALSKNPTESYVLEVVIDSHAPSGQKRFRQVTRHGLGSTPVAAIVKSVSAPSAGPLSEPGFFYDTQASYVLSFTSDKGAIKVSRLFMPLLRQAVQAELQRLAAAAAASSTTNGTQDRGNAPDHMRTTNAKEPPQREPPQKEPKEAPVERRPMP